MRRKQARKALFQQPSNSGSTVDNDTTAQLQSMIASIDKMRESPPKRRKKKRAKDKVLNLEEFELPYSTIDHEN